MGHNKTFKYHAHRHEFDGTHAQPIHYRPHVEYRSYVDGYRLRTLGYLLVDIE